MTVRAVTPRVPAIHGLVHRHDCAGDCCHWDAFTDQMATGEDIFSSDVEVPAGRGLRRFNHLVPGVSRTASREAEDRSRVHASSPTQTGRDGRGSAPSPSTSVAATYPAAANPDDIAPGSLWPADPERPSSRSGSKAETSSDVSGARRSPGPA